MPTSSAPSTGRRAPRVTRAAAWRWVVALTLLFCAAYPVLPAVGRMLVFHAIGLAAVVAVVALIRRPGARRLPWLLLGAGLIAFKAGDVVWDHRVWVLDAPPSPSLADALYLVGYPIVAAALAVLCHRRSSAADAAGLIDAAIITVGTGVVTWAFLVLPYVTDETLGVEERFLASAYPLADLLLLSLSVRLFLLPGSKPRAYRLLGLGILAAFCADTGYAAHLLTDGALMPAAVREIGWIAAYGLITAALVHPTIRHSRGAGDANAGLTRRRLLTLATATLLAPATLLIQAVSDGRPRIVLIALASAVLSMLVVVRMSGLVRRVEEQASELAAVARTDALTGVPNRRAWDDELATELRRAERSGAPVSVVLLDLDRLKAFDDRHGHPAGDRLLRDTAAAWRDELRATDVLAPYGGEEFGLILAGCAPDEAVLIVERVRAATPGAQTCSAGVAGWDGAETGEELIARADAALYAAKAAGRDRSTVAEAAAAPAGAGLVPAA
ncbi:MAG: hypothetical protein QOD55_2542 [Solirubrobacteraceae bacterium]|nr:hypothetical protein [Solirubrobacteraceae bacterium]